MEDTLAKKGWHLTANGIQRCKDGLPVGNAEAVIKNALNIDLRHIGDKFLPVDINKGKVDTLQGPCVLQVLKVRNIAAPKINEGSTFAPRMLRLQLTDGHSTCSALEIENIPKINIDTGPGTKLLLTGCISLQKGMLLLNSGNTKNLGGRVEELYSKWLLAKSLATHSRSTRQDGGPPSWVQFGQGGVQIGVQRMGGGRRGLKKSLESQREHTELDKEFEEQRKATIQELTKKKQDKSLGLGKVNMAPDRGRQKENRNSGPVDRNSREPAMGKFQKSKPEGIYRELNYKPNVVDDKDTRKLVDMGFAKDLAASALRIHHGNFEAALDSLVSESKYGDKRQERQSWPGSNRPDYNRRTEDNQRQDDYQRRDTDTRWKNNDTRGRDNDARGRDNDPRGRDDTRGRDNDPRGRDNDPRGRDDTRGMDNDLRGRDNDPRGRDNDRRKESDPRKNGDEFRRREREDFKKGGRKPRVEEEEENGGSRPSGPSTLFDFLATKLGEPEEKSKPTRKINSDYEQPSSVKEAGITFQHRGGGSKRQVDEGSNSREDDHKGNQRTGPRDTRSKNWQDNLPPRFRKEQSNSLPSSARNSRREFDHEDDHRHTDYERTFNNEGRRSHRQGNYNRQSDEHSNNDRQRNYDRRSKFRDQRSYDSPRKHDRPASYNGEDYYDRGTNQRHRHYRDNNAEGEQNRNWNVYSNAQEFQDELPSPPPAPDAIVYEQSAQPIAMVPQPQMVAVFQWKPGDSCLAMWNDGVFYPARIQNIDPTGQSFFVYYEEYGDYAHVQVGDLRPYMGQWTTQLMYSNSMTQAPPPQTQMIDSYQGQLSGTLEVRRGGQGLMKRPANGPPRDRRSVRPGTQVYNPPGGRS